MKEGACRKFVLYGIPLTGIALGMGYIAWNGEPLDKGNNAQPAIEQAKNVKDAAVPERVKSGGMIFDCNKEITTTKGKKALLCFPQPNNQRRVTPF